MDHNRGKTVSSLLLALAGVGFLVLCVVYIVTKSSTVLFGGVFLCVASVISGVVFGLVSVRLERKARTKALKEISDRLGWNFDPQPEQSNFLENVPESLKEQFPGSLPDGKTQNLITGKIQSVDFAVFDQIYLDGVGEDKRQGMATCIVLNDKQLRLPVFCCEPRRAWHRFLKFLLNKETMFENHPEFARKYRLYGPEEDALRQTFRPTLLAHLEQASPVTLAGAGNYLIAFKEDSVFSPEEIPDRLNKAIETAKLF